MQAMTWWDHETESIWSQPWGRAIVGDLKGVNLFLLPSKISSWISWRSQHPNTLVLLDDINQMPNLRQKFDPDFVIGVTLADDAKAYRFEDVAEQGVINDTLGTVPVLIWASGDTFHTYIRDIGGQTLTFYEENGRLQDHQTNSTWNIVRGLATEGPLQGQALQALPSLTAYLNHWFDFYPDSVLWEPQ